MHVGNNFSSSVTYTHSDNGLSLCTKAIAVRPAWVSVRRFKHLQGAFKALCRCFFVCVGQRMKQENV